MSDRFPVLTASFSAEPRTSRTRVYPSRREVFLRMVAEIDAAQAVGMIPNPAFQDLKSRINSAFDEAWLTVADRHVNSGKWESLPEGVFAFWHEFNHPQLHTAVSYLKRANASRVDHPLRTDMIAMLREMAILAELFASLKDMVAKRQPKPVEEQRPGYHPPHVSTEAQKVVVGLLEAVTAEAYDRLKAMLIQRSHALLKDYVSAQAAATTVLSPYDHFMGRQRRDQSAYQLIANVTKDENDGYKVRPQAEVDAVFLREATKTADAYRTSFVHKNFRKIASIIDAKGNYKDGRVMNSSVNLAGMTGWLEFNFTDGSSFRVQNSVVVVENQYGTRFMRFPLTFHDVKLPNGKMSNPSEKRMNTVFVGKDQ